MPGRTTSGLSEIMSAVVMRWKLNLRKSNLRWRALGGSNKTFMISSWSASSKAMKSDLSLKPSRMRTLGEKTNSSSKRSRGLRMYSLINRHPKSKECELQLLLIKALLILSWLAVPSKNLCSRMFTQAVRHLLSILHCQVAKILLAVSHIRWTSSACPKNRSISK